MVLNLSNHQEHANYAQMKCHYTPIRMANVKKSGDTKCCPGCGEHETFIYCWWGYKKHKLWKTGILHKMCTHLMTKEF